MSSSSARTAIKWGVISKRSNNREDYQTPQTLTLGGSPSSPQLILPYGLGTNPEEGTPTLNLSILSDDENQAAIPFLDKERLKNLPDSDVWIYSPKTQSVIKFKNDGTIEVDSSSKLNIIANGDVTVTSNSSVTVNALTANVNAVTTLGDPLGVLPPLPIARTGDVVSDFGGNPIGVISGGSTINNSS